MASTVAQRPSGWARLDTGLRDGPRSALDAWSAPDPVPALLLARLAVDHRHASLGIGTALAAHVLATAVELNEKVACRAVVVTALSDRARTWWERLGFHPLAPDERAARRHDQVPMVHCPVESPITS